MERISIGTLILTLFLVWGLTAEAKDKKAPEVDTAKLVSVGEVSKKMADIWCIKLEECAGTQEMGPKECRKVLKKSFSKGFSKVVQGQKVQVTRGKLDQCSESIKKDSCGALKTAQNLPGCGFIRLLNRS